MPDPQPLTGDVQPGVTIRRIVPGFETVREVAEVRQERLMDDDDETQPVVYLVDLPTFVEGQAHDVLWPNVFHQWVVVDVD